MSVVPAVKGFMSSVQRSFVTYEPYHNDIYQYDMVADGRVLTGVLSPVVGASEQTCPAGRVLYATNKNLYPGTNPGINTIYVGVYDPETFIRGYINPEAVPFSTRHKIASVMNALSANQTPQTSPVSEDKVPVSEAAAVPEAAPETAPAPEPAPVPVTAPEQALPPFESQIPHGTYIQSLVKVTATSAQEPTMFLTFTLPTPGRWDIVYFYRTRTEMTLIGAKLRAGITPLGAELPEGTC